MRHVIVYSDGMEGEYTHPYAIHFFDNSNDDSLEALKMMRARAVALLDKYCPDWLDHFGSEIRYAGVAVYPAINFDGEAIYIAEFDQRSNETMKIQRIIAVKELPKDVAEQLITLRCSEITLDFDYVFPYKDFVKQIFEDVGANNIKTAFKVYKTYRGLHVRIPLKKPLPLNEILERRKKYYDDSSRRRIDGLYIDAGYPFLANLLFNAKYFITDTDEYQYFKEVEVDIKKEYKYWLSHTFHIPFNVENQEVIAMKDAVVEIEKDAITIYGFMTYEEANNIFKQILKERYWNEYVDARIKLFYDVKSDTTEISDDLIVVADEKKAIIYVPLKHKPFMGRLIGKEGSRVKELEKELGLKIRIVLDETKEEQAAALSLSFSLNDEIWKTLDEALSYHVNEYKIQKAMAAIGAEKYKILKINRRDGSEIAVMIDNEVYVLNVKYKMVRKARDNEHIF